MFPPHHVTVALIALILVGCDSGATVRGTVTFNGSPIETGYVNLVPVDGKGPTSGGVVRDGSFVVEGVLPGEKIAQVVRGANVAVIRNSGDPTIASPRPQNNAVEESLLFKQAGGNNQQVTVEPGEQTIELSLTSNASH